jgi:hypothetical protein
MSQNNLKEKSLIEMPEAIKSIDKSLELLYNYKQYVDITLAINQLEKAKKNFIFVLNRYTENKGV